MIIHLCECLCGGQVNWNKRYKCFNRFINGHSSRVEHPFKGKHHKDESKEKMRLKLAGRHVSPETEIKLGDILNPHGIGGFTKKL